MKIKVFFPKISGFLFLWAFSFLVNIITFLLVIFKEGFKGENVALKYTVRAGVIWYGSGSNLYALPLLALTIMALNVAMYRKMGPQDNFFPRAIAVSNLFFQLLILSALMFLAAQN